MLRLLICIILALIRNCDDRYVQNMAAFSWHDFADKSIGFAPEITMYPIIAHYRKHATPTPDHTLTYLAMLMLIHDTGPNPGPNDTRYPCRTCSESVNWDQKKEYVVTHVNNGTMPNVNKYAVSFMIVWDHQTSAGTILLVVCQTWAHQYWYQIPHTQHLRLTQH